MGCSEKNGVSQPSIVLVCNLYYEEEATVKTEYKKRQNGVLQAKMSEKGAFYLPT